MYREDREILTQILSTIVRVQNESNQTIPHNINSSGKFTLNISTITTDESSRQMIVSPVSNTYVPHRHHNHDRLITHTTEEQKAVCKKQKQLNEREDSTKITALTMGAENQPEQPAYDPENGNESKQHHDVQTGLEQQQNH